MTIPLLDVRNLTQVISPPPPWRDENLKGSTVTAKACLMGATPIDAGGL
jgi:hypothetical protein